MSFKNMIRQHIINYELFPLIIVVGLRFWTFYTFCIVNLLTTRGVPVEYHASK